MEFKLLWMNAELFVVFDRFWPLFLIFVSIFFYTFSVLKHSQVFFSIENLVSRILVSSISSRFSSLLELVWILDDDNEKKD